MSRHARKIDDNQTEIVKALRSRGHLVQSLAAVGGGVPDLLVGAYRPTKIAISLETPGIFVLLEVKDGRKAPSARKLNALEIAWHKAYAGWPVFVVECAEDAIVAVEGL